MAIPLPIVDNLIGLVRDVGKEFIDRMWPDKVAQERERAQAELEFFRLTQVERMQDKANEVALAAAQIEVNKQEAASSSVFVAGWRPFIGWTCGASFAYSFLVGPLITQISSAYGYSFPLPPIDMDNMLYILGGMLGLGGLRTFEKVKGVNTK
jgi:Holin of 3TMs, for gene-transfer release